MKSFFTARFIALIVLVSLPTLSLAQKGKTKADGSQTPKVQTPTVKTPPKKYTADELKKLDRDAKLKVQQRGRNFYIQPVENSEGTYTLLLSDPEGKIVTREYRLAQIDIFEAIMVEAEKFALNNQGVGTSKPVVTRFFDKQEPSFFVDVAKQGNESQFFLTVKSFDDQLTVDTGKIKRSTPAAKVFFHEILKQIKDAKPKDEQQKTSGQ